MKVMYKTRSGREFTYEELKKIYEQNNPDKTEDDFDWDLYFAIEVYKTVKCVV